MMNRAIFIAAGPPCRVALQTRIVSDCLAAPSNASFIINAEGSMYADVASATNSCSEKSDTQVARREPCRNLNPWWHLRYDAE